MEDSGLTDSFRDPSDKFLQKIGYRSLAHAVFYPFEYGRTLIQLGYEPIAPWGVKTWSGQHRMMLPNIFQYVGFMKDRCGSSGLYRGVRIRIVEHVVSHIAYYVATDSLPSSNIEMKIDEGKDVTEEERRKWYLDEFIKAASGRSLAVIIGHPFHVCAVRCMAEFVGGETKYGGVFSSLKELYRENGLPGFFSGLVPRLMAEICQLAIWHSLTFALTTYVSREREHREIFSTVMGFLATTCTYPFLVVSNCMCVSGSGLAVGQPPHMKVYSSWIDCWRNLSAENQLWRGSSILLWRYDTRSFK